MKTRIANLIALRALATITTIATIAAMAGFFPAAAQALGRDAALGAEGELYTVKAGLYSELFPGQKAYPTENVALALDVQRPDTPVQRYLVRGTGTEFVESSPSLIFEHVSNTLFLVWESRPNHFNPILMLAWFQNGVWSNPIEIVGHEFADKTPPQIAITYDSYLEKGTGGQADVLRRRTLVHLLWGEKSSVELRETFYTALVLEDGAYVGKSPIYNLNELDIAEGEATSFETAASLVSAPRLAAGRDERTVAVAFASGVTRRLLSLEIDVLPAQLSQLAGGARAYIIDVGAKLSGRGLQNRNGNSSTATIREADSATLTASSAGSAAVSGDRPPVVFQFRVVSSRPAPRVGAGAISVFVSENAENVLIAWAETGKVVYLESSGPGWTPRRQLKLSPSFDLAHAYAMLADSLGSH